MVHLIACSCLHTRLFSIRWRLLCTVEDRQASSVQTGTAFHISKGRCLQRCAHVFRRDAAAVYGLTDLGGDSIAAALSDGGSQGAMFALLHPERDLDVRAAAAAALRLSLDARGGRHQGAAWPAPSLQVAEVRLA